MAKTQVPISFRRTPRIAILVPWFRSSDRTRVYAAGWCIEAERFNPMAIAGTHGQLFGLTAARPTHALIALSRLGEPLLTPHQRDDLWSAFHVPVFEQIVAEDGQLLASECEAHDGLHVHAGWEDHEHFVLDSALCGCGKASPRLVPNRASGPKRNGLAGGRLL